MKTLFLPLIIVYASHVKWFIWSWVLSFVTLIHIDLRTKLFNLKSLPYDYARFPSMHCTNAPYQGFKYLFIYMSGIDTVVVRMS